MITAAISAIVVTTGLAVAIDVAKNYVAREECVDAKLEYWEQVATK